MAGRWKLEDYEPVENRLARFWDEHPEGRVATDLIAYSDTQFIIRAEVYRHGRDEQPWASGYAEERVTDRGVNATSALENTETSAIGRALANAGYAPKGKRPSREEMQKVERMSKPQPPALDETQLGTLRDVIAAVTSQEDEALRETWHNHTEWLDVTVDGGTLRDAILARKAELVEAGAA